jgi:4-hydroxybenzoate polyprenyltransferase
MRIFLALAAWGCLSAAFLEVSFGHWGSAAAWAFGFWMACGWFVAACAAYAVVDEILDEEEKR